jgi:sulfate permease, SulP family
LSSHGFTPELFKWLRTYNRALAARDLGAGITVGIVALPLAMAFGIASGVKPEQGLITAIIGGIIVSLLGGCRLQIAGPAGAFVGLLYGIVEKYGVSGLLISTFVAGLCLILMGLFRLGGAIRYVPIPLIVGFTNGIAVIIALAQLRDFFGFQVTKLPANSLAQLVSYWQTLNSLNVQALLLGLFCVALLIYWPKLTPIIAARTNQTIKLAWLPASLLVLVISALCVKLFGLSVDTIGSRFGGIPSGLPTPGLLNFNWQTVLHLANPILAIALLCAIECLLCARVADQLSGDTHNPNQELIAQGVANMVSPLFGGFAATGTLARTVTNIKSGAATPVSGLVHGLTVLAVVIVLAPAASYIPMAGLAAVLLVVAYNMGEWAAFAHMHQHPLIYKIIFLTSFIVTVAFDVLLAVLLGLVIAAIPVAVKHIRKGWPRARS